MDYDCASDIEAAYARGVDSHTITMMQLIHDGLAALGEAPEGRQLDTFQKVIGHNVMSTDRYFELKALDDPSKPMFYSLVQEYHRQTHWHLVEAPVIPASEGEE